MIEVPWNLVLCCIPALTALYFLGWELLGPGKPLRRAAIHTAGGVAAAALWNFVLSVWGAGIRINLSLAMLSAVFGLPGTVLAGVLQHVLS